MKFFFKVIFMCFPQNLSSALFSTKVFRHSEGNSLQQAPTKLFTYLQENHFYITIIILIINIIVMIVTIIISAHNS